MKGLALNQSLALSNCVVGKRPGVNLAEWNIEDGRRSNSVSLRGKCRSLFLSEEQYSAVGVHSRDRDVRYHSRQYMRTSKRALQVQAATESGKGSTSDSVSTKAPETSTSSSSDGSTSKTNGAAISGTVPVSFSLPRRCEWGQAFYISGEAEALGAWNLDKAVPLNWTENHVWTNTIDLAVGTGTEYKFVLIGKRGHVEWQPGPNSRVDVPSDSFAPLSVLSPWDHTAGPESPPTPEEQEKEKEEAYEMLSKLSSTVKLKVAMERFEEAGAPPTTVIAPRHVSEAELEALEADEDYDEEDELDDGPTDTTTNAEAKIAAESDESDAHSDAEAWLEAELASQAKTQSTPPMIVERPSSGAGEIAEKAEGNENGAYTSRKAFGSRAASPFDGGFLAKDAQLVRQVFARLLGSLGRQTLMDEEKNKDQK
eukprot:TRINITY_DN544_c0_g1_i4.p1 TRINITY_DN544_c0_g1~~TRINITY_DN544_c0_g1_i4.p1  ORF type:complete len:426 (+),score=88.88 TRINITY_DN544_c0_g1_i4:580-1857(+)